MSAVEELLAANAGYVERFPDAMPTPPARRLAVVTCMDARLDLFAALGLRVGDAHLIRNAGGLVTPDVLRSLALSQRALGTREVVVIGHTECGMTGFDDAGFRAELAEQSGQRPDWDVPGFDDVAVSVAGSVSRIRECGWLLSRNSVAGFVFDVRTGKITVVD